MFSEFKTFLLKANVLALALAFILGVALAAVVNSLVKDIILPPVGLLFGGVDFNNLFIDLSGKHPASLKAAQDAGLATINYGVFINTVIVFIIVAFVVFLIARSFIPKAAPTKMCQFCGEEILASATRCRQISGMKNPPLKSIASGACPVPSRNAFRCLVIAGSET